MVTNKKAVKISTVTPIKKTIRAKATTIEPLKNKLEEIDEYTKHYKFYKSGYDNGFDDGVKASKYDIWLGMLVGSSLSVIFLILFIILRIWLR